MFSRSSFCWSMKAPLHSWRQKVSETSAAKRKEASKSCSPSLSAESFQKQVPQKKRETQVVLLISISRKVPKISAAKEKRNPSRAPHPYQQKVSKNKCRQKKRSIQTVLLISISRKFPKTSAAKEKRNPSQASLSSFIPVLLPQPLYKSRQPCLNRLFRY